MNSDDTRKDDKQHDPARRGEQGGRSIGTIMLIATIVIAVVLYFYYFMFTSSMGLGSR